MSEMTSGIRCVLMTADTVGGVWTYAMELSRALAARGAETVLATMGAPLNADQRRESAGLEVIESGWRLEWMDEPWEDVARAGDWLLDLEARLRPDVVHLNGYAHGALPFTAAVLVAGHSCVLSWWRAVKGREAGPAWERYRRQVRAGLRAADFVVAPTRAMLDSVVRDYGPLPATAVVSNARTAALFPAASKEPLLFTAGRLWDEAKNLAAIEAAAPKLPWPVCVAGDNRRPGGGLRGSRLRMLGRLSSGDVAAWLARASIYVLPARYEPFGLSALEAALANCALVLGDIASLREVWDEAAVFVTPGDAAMLEEELRRLIGDSAYRARMAGRARRRALEYSPARMCAGYLAAYRTAVARRNCPAATFPQWPAGCY